MPQIITKSSFCVLICLIWNSAVSSSCSKLNDFILHILALFWEGAHPGEFLETPIYVLKDNSWVCGRSVAVLKCKHLALLLSLWPLTTSFLTLQLVLKLCRGNQFTCEIVFILLVYNLSSGQDLLFWTRLPLSIACKERLIDWLVNL